MDDEFPFLPPDYAVMTPSSDDLRRDDRRTLGERRVFLPEGLGLMRSNAEGLIAVGKQLVCAEAEIVRLRAAADGIPLLLTDITERDTTIATLRAALGTARLELMQDVDPDAIVAGIDCALTP